MLLAGLGNYKFMFGDGVHVFVNSIPIHLVLSVQVDSRQIATFFRH